MKAPAATKASSQRSTTIAPAIPIATAAPIETTAAPASTREGIRVASGRPFSSSSACAPIPTARKKAASVGAEPARVPLRRERGPDHHVAEVPGRVRRVQNRDVVAPAPRRERVERGPGRASALTWTDDPRSRSRRRGSACGSGRPRSRRRARGRAAGRAAAAAQSRSMLGPRKSPTSRQPEEIRRPASGRPTPTYRRQSSRATGFGGTPNSRPAIVPPGLTTRASSVSVAPGIVDVAHQVRERQGVERGVGERQVVGVALHQPDARPGAGGGPRRASRGSGRARRPCSASAGSAPTRLRRSPWRRRGRCRAGPASGARDEEAAPARVLAEREEARVAVVRRPERGEQRLRVLPSGRGDRHRPSVCAAAGGRDEPAGSPTRTAVTGLSLSLQEDRHERALRHVPSGPVFTVSRYAAVDRVADGCDRGVVRLLGRRRARRRSADPASGEHAGGRLPRGAYRPRLFGSTPANVRKSTMSKSPLARAGSVGRQSRS